MTVGQSWDRQVPFPTDLYPPRRTKTKPMSLVSPVFQEVCWGLAPHGPGELALGGALGPARTSSHVEPSPQGGCPLTVRLCWPEGNAFQASQV